ncbi:MAG: penicillin-binding transpeptidase domain-containing protein [Desulfobacteraceae bacterium]|nr:penicillin-binding transpeptidase domain-containing protein [Desulfobacteraceae bacterium]
MNYRTPHGRPSWRDYQKQLQRPAKNKKGKRLILLTVVVGAIISSLYLGLSAPQATKSASPPVSKPELPKPTAAEARIKKSDAPAERAKPAPTRPEPNEAPVEHAMVMTTKPETKEAPTERPKTSAAKPEPSQTQAEPPKAMAVKKGESAESRLKKSEIQALFNNVDFAELTNSKTIVLPYNNQRVSVETSLDTDMQQLLLQSMDRKNSRYIGIVVMDAVSGRILSLAGFDKTDPRSNPCLSSEFPAASLFKIVTATAAVDQCNYTSETPLSFTGFKHTLYKNQLKEAASKYTTTISFADAFAQSVNPVFGKIGSLRLGKEVLQEYAQGFGFNQPLDFELPVTPSHLQMRDTPYQWAEIASGFNHDTTISPVHAAEIVATVLNDGRMVAPSLVDQIVAADGQVLYRSHPSWEQRAMTTRASKVLTDLMERTVSSGTARRIFRIKRKGDDVMGNLCIGGKTGSIYNRDHDIKIDWFVGFAKEKHGPGKLVVSVLVAHEEYIGTRAGTYARMAMTHYFENRMAQHTTHRPEKSDG